MKTSKYENPAAQQRQVALSRPAGRQSKGAKTTFGCIPPGGWLIMWPAATSARSPAWQVSEVGKVGAQPQLAAFAASFDQAPDNTSILLPSPHLALEL